nr:ankyrin repeat domain-containing protein 29 isoform X3 [Manis javanica]
MPRACHFPRWHESTSSTHFPFQCLSTSSCVCLLYPFQKFQAWHHAPHGGRLHWSHRLCEGTSPARSRHQSPERGTTALFFAAQQGHNDIVRFLFEFGASTECRTKDGGTALLAASQYGHMRVVETLLKHGANIHDQLYDGATALFLAAQGGYLDVIRLLLSSGAKVNQPRQDGTAPLWIAAQMGHSEVVRVMLLRGAERDAARNDGTTALLKAANKGYNDVIEELLKFSPTLGILKNGTSALHAAVLNGNIKTVVLLLEAGADPALRNKANELPAELTQNERILRLLRSKEGHRKS